MKNIPTFLDDALNQAFLTQLLRSADGRASMLAQLAEAEGGDGGELDIFQHILAAIDDPEVAKLVRVHKEDEERHERLFMEASRAQGGRVHKMPKEAQLLRRLDAHTGFFTKPIVDRAGVVEAYLLLLVIEERALKQFAKMRRAFVTVGQHDIAELLDAVAKDEDRHLRYCEAISKRMAPDEAARQKRIAELRALEEQCFEEVQAINMQQYLAAGFMPGGAWGVVWSTLGKAVKGRVHPLPTQAPAPVALAA